MSDVLITSIVMAIAVCVYTSIVMAIAVCVYTVWKGVLK